MYFTVAPATGAVLCGRYLGSVPEGARGSGAVLR